MFASEAAPYGFIWHLDFLIFTLLSRPYFLDFASSMTLTAAPLSGSTVTSTQLISTVFRGLLSDFPTVFTSCSVHVDSSSLLSDDVSVKPGSHMPPMYLRHGRRYCLGYCFDMRTEFEVAGNIAHPTLYLRNACEVDSSSTSQACRR